RQSDALRRTLALDEKLLATAGNAIVSQQADQERDALASIMRLAPNDKELSALIDRFSADVSSRSVPPSVRSLHAGDQVSEQAGDLWSVVPKRNPAVVGNLSVYYYDYLSDHLGPNFPRNLASLTSLPNGETLAYEALNLVNGERTVGEISDILFAAYGGATPEVLQDYFRLLEKAKVV